MLISEYYDGTNFSYEAEGEFSKKEMIDGIKLNYPLISKKLIIDEIKYIYRKWGTVKENSGQFRKGFLRCDQKDIGAILLTQVSVIQE